MKHGMRMSKVEPISPDYPLILASSSPRRKRLLRQAGIPFRAKPSRTSEDSPIVEPEAMVHHLAEKKAMAACRRNGGLWVLGRTPW